MKLNYGEDKPVDSTSQKYAGIRKALLLGMGMDGKDGHLRLTSGPNFQLIGGSENTHGIMQDTAVKFNEELHKRGKRLEDISPKEFMDILNELA